MPPIDPPTTASHRAMPRWSATAAWVRTMSRIGDDREASSRRACRWSGRSTPGRSCPGSRRARSRTRRSSGRCRGHGPGPISPSHQPAVGWPGPLGPVAWRSPVRAWHTSTALRGVGVEAAPGLVGDRRCRAACRRPRGRTAGRRRCAGTAGGPRGRRRATRRWRAARSALSGARSSGWSIVVSPACGSRFGGTDRGPAWRARSPDTSLPPDRRARCSATSPPCSSRRRDGTLGVRPRLPDPAARATRDVPLQESRSDAAPVKRSWCRRAPKARASGETRPGR